MTGLLSVLFGSYLAQAAVGAPGAASPDPPAQPQQTRAALPQGATPSTSSQPASPIANQPAAMPPPPPAPSYPATPAAPQAYPSAPASPAPSYPAPPYYYQPAYTPAPPPPPAPGNGPAPAVADESEPVPAQPHFGVLFGGGYVPHYDISGIAAGLAAIPYSTNGFETRLMLTGYRMNETYGHINGLLIMAQELKWWDSFGLGAGIAGGYAVYHSNSGYQDGSGQVVGFLAPATFRVGSSPWFEFGVIGGLTKSFSSSATPFGYLYAAVLF